VGVALETRLDQRQRAGPEAVAGELREPASALLRAAQVLDGKRRQGRRENREGDREVAPRQLLGHQRGGHRAALAAAARGLLDGIGHQSQLVGMGEHVTGKLPRLVALAGLRPDLVLGELAHGFDDQGLLVARFEVDHGEAPVAAPERAGIIDESSASLLLCRGA
jgi:hypothetical protein